MRIARFLRDGKPTYAIDTGGGFRLARGDDVFSLAATDEPADAAPDRLLAPLVPTDILGIGKNYLDHAKEMGAAEADLPVNPMMWIKSSNALGHPMDPVQLPRNSEKVDYEAELAVVIGRDARHVDEDAALDHVFGYCCTNDVSARDWQKDPKLNGGQFARGKSFDGFCPLGPYLVTSDEIADPNDLSIVGRLNGETVQTSNTRNMIFSVRKIIASLSETMTLRRGSVILTGSPAGVGAARTPPVFLKDGDVYEVEIGNVGTLTTRFVAEP